MEPEQTPKPAFNKNVLIAAVATTVIRAGVTIGVIFLLKKALDKADLGYRRVEFVPGQNGRLVANEYHMERLMKIRYATPEEVWAYSKALMDERLNEMKMS